MEGIVLTLPSIILNITMKKIIFYFSLIVSLLISINIIQMLVNDFNRLTEYGFGYLTGKIILLLIFLSLIYFTRSNLKNESK